MHLPIEHHKKIFQLFCTIIRMRKKATDILTKIRPSMTITPCANSHRKYGSNIHDCCHCLCLPMPYEDSPQKQMKVPTAINAARTIDQSSSPTKRSMHVRTYIRRATTTSAANANAPVMLSMEATLLSSRYCWVGVVAELCCRGKTGMVSRICMAWKTP